MSDLKNYHIRIPLGDPDVGYTLWETVNSAASHREALKQAKATLHIYVGGLQRALKDSQMWEVNETDQPFTGGSWPGIKGASQ